MNTSSSSSELGNRKNYYDNNSNSFPLKNHKVVSSSLICVDDFCNNFTLSINTDRNIVSVGYSEHLSHGHENNIIYPIKQIQNLNNIKMIDCGDCHSICLNDEGDVFSFGRNDSEQLGIGKNRYELEFTHIPQKINLPSCKQVSCGSKFTMCLTMNNSLYSFGNNYYGQLGLGDKNESSTFPQLIPDFNNIEYIVCGGFHSICKTYNNEFYSWGNNGYGQLGQGNYTFYNKPIQCLNWPDNIIDIKCGGQHSLLLTSEGRIYSFGMNYTGQLGIKDIKFTKIKIPTLIEDFPEIQRIECGIHHSICIDINNNLWLFGYNKHGQLGLGDYNNKYKPIIHPTLSNIIDISSGGGHTFVKTIDNKIYAFGYNKYSQLGIKTLEENQLTPIQVFQDNEDIWCSTIGRSKQKSARK